MWNEELAQVAQNYAEMCMLESNPDRVAQQSTFQSVGESFTAIGTQQPDYNNAVGLAWFGQRVFYTFDPPSCSSACDFYTQVSNSSSYTSTSLLLSSNKL